MENKKQLSQKKLSALVKAREAHTKAAKNLRRAAKEIKIQDISSQNRKDVCDKGFSVIVEPVKIKKEHLNTLYENLLQHYRFR